MIQRSIRRATAGLVLVLAATACGDDADNAASSSADAASDTASGTASTADSSQESTASSATAPKATAPEATAPATDAPASVLDEATAAVQANLAGTDRPLPTSSPAVFPEANVWVISCTQTAPGCAAPAAGIEEAGGEMGWKVTIFDGQGTPDVFAEGIRSAIADGADAVVLDAVDCVLVTAALQEARDAGVIVFATGSFDCDDPLVGGEPLFDGQLMFGDASYLEFAEGVAARSSADYVIAATGGEAKVVALSQSDALIGQHLYNGFAARIAECDACEIVESVSFTVTDLITGQLAPKIDAALTAHPEANAVYSPYDAPLLLGVAQSVVGSGRNDELTVVGGEGLEPNIALISGNQGQDMAFGYAAVQSGWAVADAVNRLLNGEPVVDSGIGLQTIDVDNNLPASGGYDGNLDADGNPVRDYRAAYRQLWGLA